MLQVIWSWFWTFYFLSIFTNFGGWKIKILIILVQFSIYFAIYFNFAWWIRKWIFWVLGFNFGCFFKWKSLLIIMLYFWKYLLNKRFSLSNIFFKFFFKRLKKQSEDLQIFLQTLDLRKQIQHDELSWLAAGFTSKL